MSKSATNPSPPLGEIPQLYHVCFAVPDLDHAMNELSSMLGIEWGAPLSDRLHQWDYRLVFSTRAPHIELVQSAAPDSPWSTTEARFHHLGLWSPSLDDCIKSWTALGAEMQYDGRAHGRSFAYLLAPHSGATLETVDLTRRDSFVARWCQRSSPIKS